MIRTLLIANRGEIACRIMRTARRLGITTIAVFSEADASAQHVRQADRAIPIGPAPARDSYLNIPRIITAARATGADAIHPGYGFLSENPAFAEGCSETGIIFVGPPASAMRAMGSKSAAKALMQRFGVPLLPGYHGDSQDAELLTDQAVRTGFPLVIKAVSGGGGRGMRVVTAREEFAAALDAARQEADRIGHPVLIKAVAGGGGKGMRRVDRAGDFADALISCRREAASSFGDDRVLIEKYILNPRHIEVQVFGDSHGNVVHLFERDCSTQRRHQKIIEEAPAPGIDVQRRNAMGDAAVAAARAVGYVGAGTVEFVADTDGFFFLEMNTRLQVEHPVTEMITGLDLVEWQLRVAAGEPLPLSQEQIRLDGHAIEARLYAEDPARDFAPSIGQLSALRLPEPSPQCRIDSGYVAGDRISVHYDAMLAKLIVHAADRDAALAALRTALADSAIVGVASNLDLLFRTAAHPTFAAGGIDTGFIGRHAPELLAGPQQSMAALAAAALAVLTEEAEAAARHAAAGSDPFSPWNACDQWWLNAAPERVLDLHLRDQPCRVRVRRDGTAWRLTNDNGGVLANATRAPDGRLHIVLDSARSSVFVAIDGERIVVRHDGETFSFQLPDPIAHAEDDDESGGRLIAPLPGQVTQVHVTVGEAVQRGAVLVVLEAMKTVFRLTAPTDGVVERVSCQIGDTVQEGQLLVSFAE